VGLSPGSAVGGFSYWWLLLKATLSGTSDTARWVPQSPSFLSSLNSMEEGREGSEKQVEAAKKLARSGSKNAAARGRPTPVHGRGHSRRWSSSMDLNIETAQAVTPSTPTAGGAATAAAVLGRSYSTSAAVAVAIDGGVKQE